MTKKKSTKRALLMSALSLMMCVTMFVGSTFAWFTDSVSSNNNIIKSGNLDVELEYYDGDSWEKVTATTNVFEENTLWEPGHTEVVYLKISNLGTLALKYNLGINIVNEIESINVAGEALRLSDYIEFGAIDDVSTPYADRAAARAAVTESAILSTGYTKAGSIEANADAQYVALVVYMPEKTGNEANYRTGEVAPKIDLGINLMATQYTSEIDSFDNKYDETGKFGGVPVARTTVLAEMPTVTTINNNTVTLDTAYVFNTTDTYDQAQLNAYRYYHADFVAYFDKDVDDTAIGLAGQYDSFSEDWLAFELDGFGDIAANTPVRMLEYAGISMNYEELCNIVKEFSCGAFAVDKEAMAGTTMTVELRLYETTKDPNATSGTANEETGEYITIGTYSYTFDAVEVSGQDELQTAINKGVTAVELSDGNYTLPSVNGKDMTISGTEDTVITIGKPNYSGSDVTLNGVTVQASGSHTGIQHVNTVTYNDVTINGEMNLYGEKVVFNDCTFNLAKGQYIWTYGAAEAEFINCTFNTEGKAILIYKDGGLIDTKVTVKGCTFNATEGDKAGAITNQNCAAIEIHNYQSNITLVTEGNTVDTDFSGEWRIKQYDTTNNCTITVNGVTYTDEALDGTILNVVDKMVQ